MFPVFLDDGSPCFNPEKRVEWWTFWSWDRLLRESFFGERGPFHHPVTVFLVETSYVTSGGALHLKGSEQCEE